MSLHDFFEVTVNQYLQAKADRLQARAGVYQIKIDAEIWHIDLSRSPIKVESGEAPNPDCALELSEEDFQKLIEGKLNIPWALATRKLKLRGDLKKVYELRELLT
ncbi:MAG: hypothetical protein EA369_03685 [Bradymonadales bacterium]|nr:MAG: hypothetical protein EA369_03685 [Bradymonadales bacterium]